MSLIISELHCCLRKSLERQLINYSFISMVYHTINFIVWNTFFKINRVPVWLLYRRAMIATNYCSWKKASIKIPCHHIAFYDNHLLIVSPIYL